MRPFCIGQIRQITIILFLRMSTIKPKQAVEKDRNIGRQNNLILQSIAEGICVLDTGEKISFANLSANRMFGGELAELADQSYEEIFFRRKKNSTEFCPIRFALAEGETSHVQNETFLRFDGTEFIVEYVCVPLIDDGEITGAVITFEDVTERRDIERLLAEVREAALENARTRVAFLANMSHEIRTPLNGIIGTTNLLFETDLTEKQRHYAEMLKTSNGLLLEIVNDILDYSKIEAGRHTLEIIEFSARDLLDETISLFTLLANDKNLRFTASIDEKIPSKLNGDGGQLRQVLNNLLSNAVKFTETGEINLKISVAAQTAEHLTLLFIVSDTGIGIDEKNVENLFQPFVQADVSMNRRFGGTGLGLAICKEIVSKMNGEIGVESRSGKGSRFWFTAQFLQNGEKSARASISLGESRDLPSEAGNLRILIVEDNQINREITSEILKNIGITAAIAENGAEALEKCRAAGFDLILMDCQMPGMDGFETSKLILEAVGAGKKPKIIAHTATSTEAEREKSFAAGMSDFLTKPIDKNDLKKMLDKHFFLNVSLQRLDLKKKLNQHFFAEIIAPESLDKLLEIESRGNQNFVIEMVELYLDYTETGLAEMRAAFAAGDRRTIKQKAHGLKGSSANIGITKMCEMFERLEEKSDGGNWTEIERSILEINDKFVSIKEIYNSKI